MIRHIVLFRFRETASPRAVEEVVAALRALPAAIPQVVSLEDGTNMSPEGLGRGYKHAFVLSFVDAAGRDIYLEHPSHKAFVALAKPLIEKALVFDIDTGTHQ